MRLIRYGLIALLPTKTPHAGNGAVPPANPDMLPRAAISDLSKGPILFEADMPTDPQYWPVTVFAHNSDTLLVANDRATGTERFRFVVRSRSAQRCSGQHQSFAFDPRVHPGANGDAGSVR